VVDSATEENYAVICLPMIEWGFRFQRPQQIMRQFAKGDHLVLYAANHFHRGRDARIRPLETNIVEISLPGDPAANVYQRLPSEIHVRKMLEAFERPGAGLNLTGAVIIVQVAFWTALAEALRERFDWPIIYDCMDDHSGFFHNSEDILDAEDRLVATSDLVVASSALLLRNVQDRARSSILLRNACEYEHFDILNNGLRRRGHVPRIGYFGAIAEWFDSELVAELAHSHPAWRFELIGSTLAGDVRPLGDLPNIRLLGERPYAELPGLIRDWDVFIIPFKRIPLTEATNPVKVYEMLATGKPIVAVALPELIPIAREGVIRLAETADEFARAIALDLGVQDPALAESRRAFARSNTWHARYLTLAAAIDDVRRRESNRPGVGESPSLAVSSPT